MNELRQPDHFTLNRSGIGGRPLFGGSIRLLRCRESAHHAHLGPDSSTLPSVARYRAERERLPPRSRDAGKADPCDLRRVVGRDLRCHLACITAPLFFRQISMLFFAQ